MECVLCRSKRQATKEASTSEVPDLLDLSVYIMLCYDYLMTVQGRLTASLCINLTLTAAADVQTAGSVSGATVQGYQCGEHLRGHMA